jgi:hypothetical protein
MMLTDLKDNYGTYNAFRPISIALTSGRVTMANGLSVAVMGGSLQAYL